MSASRRNPVHPLDDTPYVGYAIIPMVRGHVGDEIVIIFGTPAEAERAASHLGVDTFEIRPVQLVPPGIGAEPSPTDRAAKHVIASRMTSDTESGHGRP